MSDQSFIRIDAVAKHFGIVKAVDKVTIDIKEIKAAEKQEVEKAREEGAFRKAVSERLGCSLQGKKE